MAVSPKHTDSPETKASRGETERGASPYTKQKGEDSGNLTLDMIPETMHTELGKSREEQGQSIAAVREEVAFFSKRVNNIEAQVG